MSGAGVVPYGYNMARGYLHHKDMGRSCSPINIIYAGDRIVNERSLAILGGHFLLLTFTDLIYIVNNYTSDS